MSENLKDYEEALERLILGKPINVPKGTKISNDAVSMEAKRGKGAIKSGRPRFATLLKNIEAAKQSNPSPSDSLRQQLDQAKASAAKYRKLWDEALAREVSLLKELMDIREAWNKERKATSEGKVKLLKGKSAP